MSANLKINDEFLEIYRQKIEKNTNSHPVDRILFHLLMSSKEKLPEFDKEYPAWFHKAFRQVDVTEDGNLDIAIWHALNHAKIFWEVFEEYFLK
jgi:hypothetical protein